ncbi:MAG TPA: ABC transporter permease [Terriglobia bacterium]|nr:ABC transporter permease [Terriglobia bacterium]
MRRLRAALVRLGGLFRKQRGEREMAEELESHLQMHIEDNRRSGMTPEEARRQARIRLGGVEQVKEEVRDARGVRLISELGQDIRYGLRQLRRNPGFTVVAVLTLALGIGANTAMFSVLNAVLFRPLPYRSPSQLVMLWTEDPSQNLREERTAEWDVEQWQRESKAFAELAISDPASVTLTGGAHAERISVARVSANFFHLLGIEPAEGRVFSAKEAEQRQRLVLISHGFWETHFGGSQDAIGANLVIDGVPRRVIGVLPEGFRFLQDASDVWEPDTLSPDWDASRSNRGAGQWFVIGRLRPNVTIRQAQAEMSTISGRLASQMPTSERELGVRVVPLSLQETGANLRLALWMLAGAVFFVLLIAISNVTGLLLARSASRRHEIGIRVALGAGRSRIVRQLLAESLTLAAVSGLFGLLVAWAGIRLILMIRPVHLARFTEIGLEPRALGCAMVLCLLTAILVGLAPAISMARRNVVEAGEGARVASPGISNRGMRHALVVTEFALAILLLVGAVLLIRSLWSVESVDPGFRPEQVLCAQLCTPASMTAAQRVSLYNSMLEHVAALPGVKSSGIIGDIFINSVQEYPLTVEGRSGIVSRSMQFRRDEVSEGFFKTLGTPLLRGRFFSGADGPDSQKVAILNSVMVQRLWPGLDPLGRRFKLGPATSAGEWFTVVGVVGKMHREGLEKEPVAQMFVPLAQDPSRLETLLVRTSSGDPLEMAGAVKAAVQQVDQQVPVYAVATLEDRLGSFLGPRRFQASLLIVFSAVALLMAAIGIFGLIQYSVSTRTHEIGIRMALGAEKGAVLRMIIGQGLKLALAGVVIGIAGALALTRFLSSLLYGVKPTDPLTFVAVSIILLVVALVACYIPARRATKVDPMVALRYE